MIPFSPPRTDQKTIDAVAEVLRSGWITTGPKTKAFEHELNEYVGAQRTFCCNANTNGLELMLRWLGIGPGDEVIVPAYTYCATANVVVHLGAVPVMVDSGPDFCLDSAAVSRAISSRTKAIIPVDIGGLPADYNTLLNIAATCSFPKVSYKLGRIAVVADSAHSIGARYGGKLLGSQADAHVFSFHAVKNLTTAEGGAVCLNLQSQQQANEAYQWLNTRSLHGQSKDALAKTGTNAWEYDVDDCGWKCNMTDLQAAIGRVELQRYESETLPWRRAIVERYARAFSEHFGFINPVIADHERTTSYHLFMLRLASGGRARRDAIIARIFDQGVSVNVHYKPLPLLTAFKNRGFRMGLFPVAEALWETEISLPVYYGLSDADCDRVIGAVKRAAEEVAA